MALHVHVIILLGLSVVICRIQGDATAEFKSIADQFVAWNFQQHPEAATSAGLNDYNDKLQSFNLTVFPARKAKVDEFYAALTNIKKDDLSKADQLNYDVLADKLRTYIDGYQWLKFGGLNPVSFMNGEQTGMDFLLKAPFLNKTDFENFISRITLIKTRLEEYTELCREAIRLNRTHYISSVAAVPGQIDDILTDHPLRFVLYGPFNETLENVTSITPTEKEELRTRGLVAIELDVLRPFREFKTFLETEYMPNCRPAAGVGYWDQGRAFYEACLKWHLSLDLTPEEVHAKGLEEVARIQKEMVKVMRSQNFQGTIPEYFNSLRTESRFKLPSANAIIEEYEDIIHQRIQPKLGSMFSRLPSSRVRVQAMSYDGSSGGYSKGVFYANVMRPNQTFTFDMISLALHEANPGHHLQISYQMDQPLPVYRKLRGTNMFMVPAGFPRYTAYVEGWALYSEALGEEMKVYKDDYELMGRYSREMLRACRLVVDTGMHVMGWSREDAILYVSNRTSYGRKEIENQVDRYITLPGQACAYKIGELKLWELRHKAVKELGKDFDLKLFHTTILDTGAVPLRLVEQAVNQMIEKVKSQPSRATNIDQSFTVIKFSAIVFVTTFILASSD